jgi:hypothetical protein
MSEEELQPEPGSSGEADEVLEELYFDPPLDAVWHSPSGDVPIKVTGTKDGHTIYTLARGHDDVPGDEVDILESFSSQSGETDSSLEESEDQRSEVAEGVGELAASETVENPEKKYVKEAVYNGPAVTKNKEDVFVTHRMQAEDGKFYARLASGREVPDEDLEYVTERISVGNKIMAGDKLFKVAKVDTEVNKENPDGVQVVSLIDEHDGFDIFMPIGMLVEELRDEKSMWRRAESEPSAEEVSSKRYFQEGDKVILDGENGWTVRGYSDETSEHPKVIIERDGKRLEIDEEYLHINQGQRTISSKEQQGTGPSDSHDRSSSQTGDDGKESAPNYEKIDDEQRVKEIAAILKEEVEKEKKKHEAGQRDHLNLSWEEYKKYLIRALLTNLIEKLSPDMPEAQKRRLSLLIENYYDSIAANDTNENAKPKQEAFTEGQRIKHVVKGRVEDDWIVDHKWKGSVVKWVIYKENNKKNHFYVDEDRLIAEQKLDPSSSNNLDANKDKQNDPNVVEDDEKRFSEGDIVKIFQAGKMDLGWRVEGFKRSNEQLFGYPKDKGVLIILSKNGVEKEFPQNDVENWQKAPDDYRTTITVDDNEKRFAAGDKVKIPIGGIIESGWTVDGFEKHQDHSHYGGGEKIILILSKDNVRREIPQSLVEYWQTLNEGFETSWRAPDEPTTPANADPNIPIVLTPGSRINARRARLEAGDKILSPWWRDAVKKWESRSLWYRIPSLGAGVLAVGLALTPASLPVTIPAYKIWRKRMIRRLENQQDDSATAANPDNRDAVIKRSWNAAMNKWEDLDFSGKGKTIARLGASAMLFAGDTLDDGRAYIAEKKENALQRAEEVSKKLKLMKEEALKQIGEKRKYTAEQVQKIGKKVAEEALKLYRNIEVMNNKVDDEALNQLRGQARNDLRIIEAEINRLRGS